MSALGWLKLAVRQTIRCSFNLAHVDDSVNKNILDSLQDECYNALAVVVHIRRRFVHGAQLWTTEVRVKGIASSLKTQQIPFRMGCLCLLAHPEES